MQSATVHLHRGAVGARAVHRDLELARQPGELGMKGRPLPDYFAPEERIDDLVRSDAREMVGGDIAHAVARGLYGVHLHARELGEDVGYFLDLRPVVLDVLARAEVAGAPGVGPCGGRRGRNSSSESRPVRKGWVWSRNWATRSSTSRWSISS